MRTDLCQRHYGDGRPCQQAQRYRLPNSTPSCWRHLTFEERSLVVAKKAARMAEATAQYMSEGNVYLTWQIPSRAAGQSDREYLKAFHDGRCAWCGRTDEPLVRDHDHDTELSRGLLCTGCNQAESVYGRYIKRGEVARPHAWDLYRRVPPASLLSVRIRQPNDPRCRCGCQPRRTP
ncbi:endonuclease domain-containing protein [Streptomyces sp. NPDC021080]|uniref:endonuclease domain-containing protein n=1 Tax=Streptomyces sp. NPDC021080 TaxID=3365110 RepID=UPI0037AA411F